MMIIIPIVKESNVKLKIEYDILHEMKCVVLKDWSILFFIQFQNKTTDT